MNIYKDSLGLPFTCYYYYDLGSKLPGLRQGFRVKTDLMRIGS